MIHKPLTSVLTLICVVALARADAPKVSVVNPNGDKTSFEKTEINSINLASDRIEVVRNDGQKFSFDKKDISHILLADNGAGVNLIDGAGRTISVKADKEMISVSDAVPGAAWVLADMSGRLVKEGVCRDGSERIDIASLPSGIYIFSISDQSVKLIKR